MCGIVGLFLKDKTLESVFGDLLANMLVTMSDRGPDSAGFAIYGSVIPGKEKLTIQSTQPNVDFSRFEENELRKSLSINMNIIDTHAVIYFPTQHKSEVMNLLFNMKPSVRILGGGTTMEIFKEVGTPDSIIKRFGLSEMAGTHGIGHTRMATESAISTLGAHPFSTGADQCLVHNGSLSNHNSVRRQLVANGMKFETQNDSEVAASFLTCQMREGASLGEALDSGLSQLDGFYTFVVGTKDGFGVLRDPIACKPAVMAETHQYVAFGSEYRALVDLPEISSARVWEPEPAKVYFWNH